MTPEEKALRQALAAAFLAELWPVSRELPAGERAAKRQADWEQRIVLADREKASTSGCEIHNAA